MGKPISWTDEMTNAALEHLETDRGTTGLYLKNRTAALEEGVKYIAERCPGRKVTALQLSTKFDKLWTRHRNPDVPIPRNSSLFSEGRNALTPAYSRDCLNKCFEDELGSGTGLAPVEASTQGGCHLSIHPKSKRTNDLSSRRPSYTAARKRIVRASSSSRYDPARVEGNREWDTASGTWHNVKRFETVLTNPIVLVQVLSTEFQHKNVFPPLGSAPSVPDLDLSRSRYESPMVHNNQDQPNTGFREVSSKQEGTVMNSYASFPGDIRQKCLVAVNDYLLENPEIYSPSLSLLEMLKGTVVKEILFAIRDLLKASKTDIGTAPQLYSSLSSTEFFDICKRVYGVGCKEDLRRTSETLLLHSPVNITDFIRAMVAAAVNEWVFDGRHNPLPNDLGNEIGVSAIYESELAKLYPALHEQILRKSRHIYINEMLDLKVFVAELSDRLSGALRPFLITNLATADSESLMAWRNNLDKIFHAALRLKVQVMLGNQQFFKWPRAGECFNHTTMRTEDGANADNLRKVHLTLFPALVEKLDMGTIQDRSKERIIFPAVVILQ